MKIEITGKFTEGHYNEMEAGYPVFIDSETLSDIVKEKLMEMGLNTNFCDESPAYCNGDELSQNKLIGKKVKMTLEWGDE